MDYLKIIEIELFGAVSCMNPSDHAMPCAALGLCRGSPPARRSSVDVALKLGPLILQNHELNKPLSLISYPVSGTEL
jgi:hypothetical protein